MADKNNSKNRISFADITLYLSYFGRYICLIFVGIALRIGRAIAKFAKYIWKKSDNIKTAAAIKLRYLLVLVVSPFLKVIHRFQRAQEDIFEDGRKYGFLSALKCTFMHLGSFIFGKNGIASSFFNIAAPIICIIFFFNIVSYASGLEYCVKLTVNDRLVGYVENEQVFYDADEILKQRINYLGSDENIKIEPSFAIELSGTGGTQLLTKYQVADKILEYSDISVEYAYGFYLNGIFMGALLDNTDVSNTLNSIIGKYKVLYPKAEISFKDSIEYTTAGLYLSGSIIDSDWLISQLTSIKSKAGYYIVEEEDTKQSIGAKLGLTQSQLELMNPGFASRDLKAGSKIKSREETPFLSVNVTVAEEYDVPVKYSTEYYNDSNLYAGVSRVTTEGQNGLTHYTAKVTYVNGIETKRQITSESAMSRPVTELIAIGTKPTPEMYSPEEAGYGKFIWPTVDSSEGGYLSEYTHWDGGYAGHCGIDICAYYGAPIYAGASGKVVFAGVDNSGFGNYVIIDHENGYQTLYGHCSALYVKTGQSVTQGEFIAAMGATGIVTGTHLHFEVHQGDQKLNPVDYLEKIYKKY